MNIFWQENIQEASKQWVTYTASGYCLTTAFVRVHADIPTEMARPRRETLGSNILNLGQAWKGRIPWDSKKVHGKGRPPTWNTNVNKHLYSDRNTSKHYKCCYHHAIDSGNIRNHLLISVGRPKLAVPFLGNRFIALLLLRIENFNHTLSRGTYLYLAHI